MLNIDMSLARLESSKKFEKVKKFLNAISIVGTILLGTAAVLIARSISWVLNTWANLTIEEIIYHLTMPMEGTNSDMIGSYISYCVVVAVWVAIGLFIAFCIMKYKKKSRMFRITKLVTVVGSVLSLVFSVQYFWRTFNVSAYVKNQNTYSSFIDDNYADPTSTNIVFPEEKRNLIYIFLESMENTYADVENGGAFEENVIPELTVLSEENENFSGSEKILNGGHVLTGTTWTIGAMFAQTCGLPLLIPLEGNSMDTQESFFPGVTALGDILEREGYQQALLIGSEASFGGRDLYFEQHGNYAIYDYNYSLEYGEIPEGYRVWWGYEDAKLFENAKTRLNELASSDEPFNLTILTADTHFEDGYFCSDCENIYDGDNYSNVMACSSKKVTEFVQWVQEQPFYENTTIVISGDHLTMDSDYCENVSDDYGRKVYTTYINAPLEPVNNEYREYSTFDNFPTTLASLGVTIEGDRLGLGTNLFSSEETLVEQYGVDAVEQGLAQKSLLMESLVSYINRADANISAYDTNTGTVTITIENIHWDKEYSGVECEYWLDGTAQEVQVVQGRKLSDDSYQIELQDENFTQGNGTYILNVYLVFEDATKELVQSGNVVYGVENESEQASPEVSASADITVSEYDYHTGKFEVDINNLLSSSNIVTIRGAVWAEEDQSDLRWYEVTPEEGRGVIEVYASDFYFKEAVYSIHIYAIDELGNEIFIAATEGVIS